MTLFQAIQIKFFWINYILHSKIKIKYVNLISFQHDPYDGASMGPDDGGISEIQITCTQRNGQPTNSIKLGTYYTNATSIYGNQKTLVFIPQKLR